MSIEVTDEMIAAARDAAIAIDGHCLTYRETRESLAAVLALIDPPVFVITDAVLDAVWQCSPSSRSIPSNVNAATIRAAATAAGFRVVEG